MKIIGKVIDAITKKPLQGAKVKIVIDNSERATLYTDGSGVFEHNEEQNYSGNEMHCQVVKKNYKNESQVYLIEGNEVELEVELVPEDKIPLMLKAFDQNKSPLEGVKISISIESKEIETGVSDSAGRLTIYLNHDLAQKSFSFKAERSGYQTASGEATPTKDNIHQIVMNTTAMPHSSSKKSKVVLAMGGILCVIILVAIFYPGKPKPPVPPRPSPADTFSLLGPSGGEGGIDFSDTQVAGFKLVEVRIRSGNLIDAIQTVYKDASGKQFMSKMHGGGGGTQRVFKLSSGERITHISGKYGAFIDSLQIRTSNGRSERFGGNGGSVEYTYSAPPGKTIYGFFGRCGKYVDAIGVILITQ